MDYTIKSYGLQLSDIDEKGTVLFYASRFGNEDSDGDIMQKGAFKKTLSENKSRLRYLYQHRMDQQLGVVIDANEVDDGLLVKAAINMDKDIGRNAYADYQMAMKYGRSVEHSIGFYTVKSQGTQPRYIQEAKLMEVSFVTWGANPNTPLLSIKSQNDICFLDKCISEGNYTKTYHDQLIALRQAADKMALDHKAAAEEDLVTFFNLLKL